MKKLNKFLCALLALVTLCGSTFALESVEIKDEYNIEIHLYEVRLNAALLFL